jgi:hypothetical protein
MSTSRYFGPRPGPALLETLGLAFPADVFGSACDWYERADQTAHEWEQLYHFGLERVGQRAAEPATPSWWSQRADLLVREARLAGLRWWLDSVLDASVPILSTHDLGLWCALQQCALQYAEEVYSVHLRDSADFLYDSGVLEMFASVILDASVTGAAWHSLEEQFTISILGGSEVEVSYYCHLREIAEVAGYPVPGRLGRSDFISISTHLRSFVALLVASGTQSGPPSLADTTTANGCSEQLERILNWCREEATNTTRVSLPHEEAVPAPSDQRKQEGEAGRKQRVPIDVAHRLTLSYLLKHPRATIREVSQETGASTGSISKTPAWKAFHALRSQPLPPGPQRPWQKEVFLTKKIMEAFECKGVPSDELSFDELALLYAHLMWTPAEQEWLANLNPEKRREAIMLKVEELYKARDTRHE